ncbi:MAG: hypothetical protein GWN18_13985, partial [Thermoplasmata archaeon]|nr:hypothetical protein [Thermoplasmata archaeon]NIS13174.1 hypothetical protein [Thermoplasmata archaeon]NIS21065.1 hypothetical protein [Thermoplasmata archaeon]NIT78538.1 hypothetical protein [Thermoplasmata archaeon]NIU50116.1 hypothetical protein [Thermoplasmata archaeon]
KNKKDRAKRKYDPFSEDFEEQLERDITERIHTKLSKKLGGRDNAVMTRLSDEDLGKLDALVELEVFRSRSEAVAFFVREGMKVREDLFASVMPTVDRIRELKEQAKRSLEQEPQVPDGPDENDRNE